MDTATQPGGGQLTGSGELQREPVGISPSGLKSRAL